MLKAIKLSGNMSLENLEQQEYTFEYAFVMSPVYFGTWVDDDPPSFGLTRPTFFEVLETMFDTFI